MAAKNVEKVVVYKSHRPIIVLPYKHLLWKIDCEVGARVTCSRASSANPTPGAITATANTNGSNLSALLSFLSLL